VSRDLLALSLLAGVALVATPIVGQPLLLADVHG
jgi:hypothetical protein